MMNLIRKMRASNFTYFRYAERSSELMDIFLMELLTRKISMRVDPTKMANGGRGEQYFDDTSSSAVWKSLIANKTISGTQQYRKKNFLTLYGRFSDLEDADDQTPIRKRIKSFNAYAQGDIGLIGNYGTFHYDMRMRAKDGMIYEYDDNENRGPFFRHSSLNFKYLGKESSIITPNYFIGPDGKKYYDHIAYSHGNDRNHLQAKKRSYPLWTIIYGAKKWD